MSNTHLVRTIPLMFMLLLAAYGDADRAPALTTVSEPSPEVSATVAPPKPASETTQGPTTTMTSVPTPTATMTSVASTATEVIQLTAEPPIISISHLQLNDIDDEPLMFLSVDDHPYFGGYTPIHGTISIEGEGYLERVTLEIIEHGNVVAVAELTENAQEILIGPFGEARRRELTQSQLLFRLPADGFEAIDKQKNGYLTLRVHATTTDGQIATADYRPGTLGGLLIYADGEVVARDYKPRAVGKLVFYADENRYRSGNLDAHLGGNDWVQPGVRSIVSTWPDVMIGDFSNMNGGPFPPHYTHHEGLDVDVWFPGYENHDAYAAEMILNLVDNKIYTPLIHQIFVAYRREPGDPFWGAIKDVRLSDGRSAIMVFQPELDHSGHFHVRFHAWIDQ